MKKKDKVQFTVEKIRVKNDDNKKFQRDEERKRSILNVDQEKLKENIKKQIEYVRKQSSKAPLPKGQELKISVRLYKFVTYNYNFITYNYNIITANYNIITYIL